MLSKVKDIFNEEIQTHAHNNIIKKLQKQGIDYHNLADEDFDDLVADEIEILKSDSKKVGMGIGIGLLISMVTGI